MLIAVNAALRRNRSRLGVMLATLALSAAVTTAHGALAGDHMGGMQMAGEPADVAMTMCLAVIGTAALTLGAIALASALRSLRLLPWRLAWPIEPALAPSVAVLAPRARPPDLSVLQVFRR